MMTALRAISRSAWRERFNQSWRFSRAKAGLWLPACQAAVALLLLWRLTPAPAPLLLPVAAAACLGLLLAFTTGLLLGRESLYGRSALRALHISPVTGSAILTGFALAELPQRLYSSLLIAAVTGLLLPAGPLWQTLPLLWAVALSCSLLGYAAALLTLVGWVRLTPASLAIIWGIGMLLAFFVAVILIGLLAAAPPVTAAIAALRPAAPWLSGGIGTLVLLPGLLMGTWVAIRPESAGEWYREAYLRMQEFTDGRRPTRPSRWPRLLPGAAGAMQARLWRENLLNPFTLVRLGFMLLTIGLLLGDAERLTLLATRFPVPILVGGGLLAALGGFGELPAAAGGSDGPNIGLALAAGVPAAAVVKGKWVATLPFALLPAAATLLLSLAVGRPSPALSLASGLIGLGFAAIALSGGLFDLDPLAEGTEREVPPILRAALEQIPRRPGAVTGYFGGVGFVLAAVWLCQHRPEWALPLAALAAALAQLAPVAGWRRLQRLGV